MKAATAGNAVHGFGTCGIWHLNMAKSPASAYVGIDLFYMKHHPVTFRIMECHTSATHVDVHFLRIPSSVKCSTEPCLPRDV
jgi:hypothetical protein